MITTDWKEKREMGVSVCLPCDTPTGGKSFIVTMDVVKCCINYISAIVIFRKR